ncbi:MAG: LamG-like jellyroll fold domain-containing protein [Clostridia bacterium]
MKKKEHSFMKKFLSIAMSALLLCSCLAVFAFSAAAANNTYVSDGLLAMYDAKQNTKTGFDAKATSWYDATGKGNNIAAVPVDDSCYFKDGYYMNSAKKVLFPNSIKDLISSGEFSTELVIGSCEITGTTWGTLLNSSNDQYSLFYKGADDTLHLKNTGNPRPHFTEAKKAIQNSTITVTFKAGGDVSIYLNGVLKEKVAAATKITADDFYFGHDDPAKSHNTQYKAMRFYSKALTAEQVAANYKVDTAASAGDTSSKPAESSKPTPGTSDNGIIALAVISVIAVAGAVAVKKFR